MPSFCHSLSLPCARDESTWIENKSSEQSVNKVDNNRKSSSQEVNEDKNKQNRENKNKSTKLIEKESKESKESDEEINKSQHDQQKQSRNLYLSALINHSSTPSSKERCLNPHHVHEMMVRNTSIYIEYTSLNMLCYY